MSRYTRTIKFSASRYISRRLLNMVVAAVRTPVSPCKRNLSLKNHNDCRLFTNRKIHNDLCIVGLLPRLLFGVCNHLPLTKFWFKAVELDLKFGLHYLRDSFSSIITCSHLAHLLSSIAFRSGFYSYDSGDTESDKKAMDINVSGSRASVYAMRPKGLGEEVRKRGSGGFGFSRFRRSGLKKSQPSKSVNGAL